LSASSGLEQAIPSCNARLRRQVSADGALEGRDGAYQVAASFQFLFKIELCSGILGSAPPLCGIPLSGSVIALAAQHHTRSMYAS